VITTLALPAKIHSLLAVLGEGMVISLLGPIAISGYARGHSV
jgi:hypothetical protein